MLAEPTVLVGIGGILGANARYLVSIWAARRFGASFPYGTLIVNLTGSVLLGFMAPEETTDDTTAQADGQ